MALYVHVIAHVHKVSILNCMLCITQPVPSSFTTLPSRHALGSVILG